MAITVTQAKILHAHLSQVAKLFKAEGLEQTAEGFQLPEIIGSFFYELGPFVMIQAGQRLQNTTLDIHNLPEANRQKIAAISESCTEELKKSIDTGTLPGSTFREILAQLLEELAPVLIQALITILLQKEEVEA